MSYSKRDWAQRKLKQANEALDKSLTYCAEVAVDYKSHTPKVSEALELVGQGIALLQQTIEDVRGIF